MSVEVRTTRRLFGRRGPHTDQAANLLSYPDQALFLALRVTDQESIIQATWIYEHPLNYEGLQRFHANFGYGVAGRLIEPSPLPFGRHRWVAAPGAPLDIEMCPPRDRQELTDWLDERAQLPVDPQWGPGWRIGVLPMTDGSTAVTLTGSHALGDGIAASMRVFQAVSGMRTDLGYPPPGSRTPTRAMLADMRQAARDLPDAGRAVAELIRLGVRRRRETRRVDPAARKALPVGELKGNVMLPAIFATLDVGEWDATAERLGGNGHSLLAGFAAKVAEKLGRISPEDGTVTLLIPISERESFEDDRANAVSMASAKVDPTDVSHDLSAARAAMRDSVAKARTEPDQLAGLMALIPWVPKRAVRGIADAAFGFSADLPVFCSNVGDLPVEMLRVDGTEAEYMFIRGIDRRVTREALEKRRGLLTVMAGRVDGRMLMSVVAYQPGWGNTRAALREVVVSALAEFGLDARVE